MRTADPEFQTASTKLRPALAPATRSFLPLPLRTFEPSSQTLVTAGTSFPAVKVEVAEQDPTSTFTPSAPDSPSIPQPPQIPPNTVLSAPAPNNAEPSSPRSPQPSSEQHLESQPRPRELLPSTNQLLGRRRRAPSDDYDPPEPGLGLSEASASSNILTSQPTPKRRRANETMLASTDATNESNGTSKAFANGKPRISPTSSTNGNHRSFASTTNGSSKARAPETYYGHDREEVTRILIQALSDMGYHGAAESVSKDSGFELENQTVSTFRNAILNGAWDQAEDLLTGAISADGRQAQGDNGLVLKHDASKNLMRFWIRQQKYLELLEERDITRALAVLRNEVTPLYQDPQRLQLLSGLLMCPTPADLKSTANWDGAYGESRKILLSELSKCISASVMLPEHRLASLFQQVKQNQIGMCMFHSSADSPSLYSDHTCERQQFPSQPVIDLDDHRGEVWQVVFSHDGSKLATCGDKQVIIYDVPSFKLLHTLGEHTKGIGNAAWSWDDSMIVTCCQDQYARLWDAKTGALMMTTVKFTEPVSSCVWALDNQSFVVGALDRVHPLTQWNIHGNKIMDWSPSQRVEDLTASTDGRWLVTMDDKNHIHVYNFRRRELEYSIDLHTRLTSLEISADSRFLLVNHRNGVAKLFDLALREHVQSYVGATGGDFLIRSTMGGANETFVISGSEGGDIFIWHKATALLVEKLAGHQPRTNSVAWSPTNPCLLASCGDDGKISIWSNPEWQRWHTARFGSKNGRVPYQLEA
ncbi:hypothetical protein LQW54_005601 [Pestalotiopsis sp. IQ-011]